MAGIGGSLSSAASGGSSAPGRGAVSARARGVRVLGALVFNLALVAGALAVYYFGVLDRQQSFRTERSFRALGEIAVQIDNRLGTIEALFKAVPDLETDQGADLKRYVSGLAITGLRAALDPDTVGKRCRARRGTVVEIDQATPLRTLSVFSCGDAASPASPVRFELPLRQLLAGGDVLAEFEHLAVVAPDGLVLTLASRGESSGRPGAVHDEIVDRPKLRDLRDLLVRAQNERLRTTQPGAGADTALTEALSKELGSRAPATEVSVAYEMSGRRYRAYLAPLQPPHALEVEGCEENKAQCKHLLLVGLRAESALDSATARLGAEFNWYLILLCVSGFALVPLLRLMLLEPHDAIGRNHARLVLGSWLLLPALLMLAGLSILAQNTLAAWADYGARRYALAIQDVLAAELETVLRTMDQAQGWYAAEGFEPGLADGTRLQRCQPQIDADKAWTQQRRQYVQMLPPPRDGRTRVELPAAKSVFRVDAVGSITRPTLTAYDCVNNPQANVDVSTREYFSVLRAGAGWPRPDQVLDRAQKPGPEQTPEPASQRFVAQRLFNRLYGDKLLQLAVPITTGDADGQRFDGILSADTALYPLTAAVLPAGYEFAIFDRDTGTVLIHSDDRRSLVESFYTEAQRTPGLVGAIRAGVAGAHRLDYFGVDRRVYYLPVTHAPWGIAVLHRADLGGALVLGAGLTALVLYGAALLICAPAAWLLLRPGHRHLGWVSPQWRLRQTYPLLALLLLASLVVQVGVFLMLADMYLASALLLGCVSLLASASALLSPYDYRRYWRRRYRFWLALVCDALLIVLLLWRLTADGALLPGWMASSLAALALHAGLIEWARRQARAAPVPPGDAWRRDSALRLLPQGLRPDSIRRTGQLYALCVSLLALQLYAVPMSGFFLRALSIEQEAAVRSGLTRSLGSLQRREQTIDQDLRRYVQDPAERQRFSTAAHSALSLAAPGFSADANGRSLNLDLLDPLAQRAAWPQQRIARDPLVLWFWQQMARRDGERSYRAGLMQREVPPASAADLIEQSGSNAAGEPQRIWVRHPASWHAHLFSQPPERDTTTLWSHGALVAGLLLGGIGGFFWLLRLVSRRLLGLDLMQPAPAAATLAGVEPTGPCRHRLLVGSPGVAFERAVFGAACPDVVLSGRVHLGSVPLPKPPASGAWLLSGFDLVVLDPARRVQVLEYLERCALNAAVEIHLMCAIDPLHRMANPDEYSAGVAAPGEPEMARWCELLSGFGKQWLVAPPPQPVTPLSWERQAALRECIDFECPASWPRLREVRAALVDLLDRGWMRTEQDVQQFMLTLARAQFQRMWLSCSTHERLALHHLAQGHWLNPMEGGVTQLLLWKGLIALRPDPQLANQTLRRFVLSAESPAQFAQWTAEARQGAWQAVRVPLLIVLLLLAAWASYSSGEAFQAAAVVLAGALTFLGNAMRAASLVRGVGGDAK